MKNFNDLRIGEILLYLQDSVKANVAKIKDNNKQAQASLEKGSAGVSEVNEFFSKNIKLTAENNEMLQLHNGLLKFFKEHREKMELTWGDFSLTSNQPAEVDNGVDISDEEYVFEQTIVGALLLNDEHPMVKDETFLQRLLSHYLAEEEYENCAKIQKYLSAAMI